eukprot:TRINITY_DN598_c0_g1_i1.p1 TRINITY_DN598_c0_g1~~TRINITY_DN598_c0_g1_i1.p1  ORF type:complete len:344 (+),score=104.12 TRINITY_DN598_c0_g1_i1:80-1111(+)
MSGSGLFSFKGSRKLASLTETSFNQLLPLSFEEVCDAFLELLPLFEGPQAELPPADDHVKSNVLAMALLLLEKRAVFKRYGFGVSLVSLVKFNWRIKGGFIDQPTRYGFNFFPPQRRHLTVLQVLGVFFPHVDVSDPFFLFESLPGYSLFDPTKERADEKKVDSGGKGKGKEEGAKELKKDMKWINGIISHAISGAFWCKQELGDALVELAKRTKIHSNSLDFAFCSKRLAMYIGMDTKNIAIDRKTTVFEELEKPKKSGKSIDSLGFCMFVIVGAFREMGSASTKIPIQWNSIKDVHTKYTSMWDSELHEIKRTFEAQMKGKHVLFSCFEHVFLSSELQMFS